MKNSVFLPEAGLSGAAGLHLVDHPRSRSLLGADRLRSLVSHGLQPHPLRHRLLHLSPVRARRPAVAAAACLDRQDRARPRSTGADRPRRHRLASRGRHARGETTRPDRAVGPCRSCRRANRRCWRDIATAPAMLRAIDFSVPREQAIDFGRARLRITWDDRPTPSVDAPVALFFGAGTLYNRDDREYLVKAFPVHVRFDADRVHLACYFPMPFFKSARIELVGGETAIPDVAWRVRSAPSREPAEYLTYFHATYVDHGQPAAGPRFGTARHPRGPKGAAIGRGTLSAPRSSFPTPPTSARWKAIRVSSSTTAIRRKARGPAPRNGAAAATIGAARP